MKIPLFSLEKKKSGERKLPAQLLEPYRPDLIQRAVRALQSASRQAYGKKIMAGMRHSTTVSKRRRDYKTSYGVGMSRAARKVLSKRGTRMFWVGAFSPQATGGRRAHPPKAEKNYLQKINEKENRKALRSAAAATFSKMLVQQRGHKVPEEYPFIIETSFEQLSTTKKVEECLQRLGFADELLRAAERKVRAGKGKLRGRKYQQKKSALIVVGEKCPLMSAARNLPGIEVVPVKEINAELLAPGAFPGRVALWTQAALDELEKENLFN